MTRPLATIFILCLTAGCVNRPFPVFMTGHVTTRMPTDNTASPLRGRIVAGSAQAGGRVAVIDVNGLLVDQNLRGLGSMGENPVALFREKLDAAAADPTVCAVVLRIDSPGGGVTASDIMRRDLTAFTQRRPVPVVACLMDVATGGAYYLATAADTIIAHPTTLTGGIGVILNLYNLEDTLGQFNVIPLPVKSGEMIDLASPVRSMEPEEREMLEHIAREFHERFIGEVYRSRPQHTAATSDFNGRVLTAGEALQKQLIDGIGYLDDAIATARQAAALSDSAPVIMFRRCNDRAMTAYDITPNIPLQNSLLPISVPGLDRSSLPRFLYLWQPDPSLLTAAGAR